MNKVYVNTEMLWVVQAKSILESHGIPCFIRNEYASSIAGKVPFNETWPELWVHNTSDVEQAATLLKQWEEDLNALESHKDQSHYASWKCSQCGESNEGNFAQCWSCGFELQEV